MQALIERLLDAISDPTLAAVVLVFFLILGVFWKFLEKQKDLFTQHRELLEQQVERQKALFEQNRDFFEQQRRFLHERLEMLDKENGHFRDENKRFHETLGRLMQILKELEIQPRLKEEHLRELERVSESLSNFTGVAHESNASLRYMSDGLHALIESLEGRPRYEEVMDILQRLIRIVGKAQAGYLEEINILEEQARRLEPERT